MCKLEWCCGCERIKRWEDEHMEIKNKGGHDWHNGEDGIRKEKERETDQSCIMYTVVQR